MDPQEWKMGDQVTSYSAGPLPALNNDGDFLMMLINCSEDRTFDLREFIDTIDFMELHGFIEQTAEHQWQATEKGEKLIRELKKGLRLSGEISIKRKSF